MLPLKEFISSSEGFATLLNPFGLAEEGIMLNKDGSFTACFEFFGPDMESLSSEELEILSSRVNKAFLKLGSGWTLNVDAIRDNSSDYPESKFPNAVAKYIDNIIAKKYNAGGDQFETKYILSLTFLAPKLENTKMVQKLFISGENEETTDMNNSLRDFKRKLEDIESYLSNIVTIKRLDSILMARFYLQCILGRKIPVNLPEPAVYLNHYFGAFDFIGGAEPSIDGTKIGAISLVGFPSTTYGGMLRELEKLDFPYRFSNRFIFMDPLDAEKSLKKMRTKLHNKQFSIFGSISQIFAPGSGSKYENSEAISKAEDADIAVNEAREGDVKYGYYTASIIILGTKEEIKERLLKIRKIIENKGFLARIENLNIVECYLGSIPGHIYPNICRPMIHSLNLAHMLPLNGTWSGLEHNPNPMFGKEQPALFYASSDSSTPFRFNLHVGDVGHTLMLGTTGTGKSTLLAFIAAQFFRYENAQIFAFDKGRSLFALCHAMGGNFYDILNDNTSFCPLALLEDPEEELFICSWLEDLLELQGLAITPKIKKEIGQAVKRLSVSDEKTFSELYLNITDKEIKSAMHNFIDLENGSIAKLFDAEKDSLRYGNFELFETEEIMNSKAEFSIPVLMYLFHSIERRLDGRPTLIILDEAWSMISDDLFKEKIREWLKTLRKKNASVIFATQSLSDVMNSDLMDVLIESCPTKIFLANPKANTNFDLYKKLGLSEKQVEIISKSTPKRQYYYYSPIGSRLMDLEFDKRILPFIGISSPKEINSIKKLMAKEDNWQKKWLEKKTNKEEAKLLENIQGEY